MGNGSVSKHNRNHPKSSEVHAKSDRNQSNISDKQCKSDKVTGTILQSREEVSENWSWNPFKSRDWKPDEELKQNNMNRKYSEESQKSTLL